MDDLWGEEHTPQPAKRRRPPHAHVPTVPLHARDCPLYGHTWQTTGLSGEKRCTICGAKGACPGCAASPLPTCIQPVYCTRHMPRREVQP